MPTQESPPYKCDPVIVQLLEDVGIENPQDCIRHWAYVKKDFNSEHDQTYARIPNIDANVEAIDELENARTGSVGLLNKFYNIRHFGRYPLDMLVEQFDAHARQSVRYGLLISAAQDWNGGFTIHSTVPGVLYSQSDSALVTRACEALDETEFKQLLVRMDATYGNQQKIGFMAIQAHGSRCGLHLSLDSFIDTDHIEEQLEGTQNVLNPEAPIAIFACDTGAPQGIAQALSKFYGTWVVAPTSATAPGHPTLYVEESTKILPDYHLPLWDDHKVMVKPALYLNGEKATPEERLDYLGAELDKYTLVTVDR